MDYTKGTDKDKPGESDRSRGGRKFYVEQMGSRTFLTLRLLGVLATWREICFCAETISFSRQDAKQTQRSMNISCIRQNEKAAGCFCLKRNSRRSTKPQMRYEMKKVTVNWWLGNFNNGRVA
jgi:hypothetical protein